MSNASASVRFFGLCFLELCVLAGSASGADTASVNIDTTVAGRRQVIDGFGTCLGNDLGKEPAFQELYFDDLGCSIVRMDLTPRFVAPYSDAKYCSPWFYNSPGDLTFPPGTPVTAASKGGPDKNNCRTYTGPRDYSREFGGRKAPIAVMGPDIAANIKLLDLSENGALAMAKGGLARQAKLGDFKLYGSMWSPAPWVKVSAGNVIGDGSAVMPPKGTPWPFIWGGNFAGGKLDVSGTPVDVFNDGTGPTSALTQFARCTAAYLKGLQDKHGVHFYGISIQNELNFEEFYNSCTYPLSSQYIAAVKAVKKEFLRYPDLKDIRIVGPEDLLGESPHGMWQYGSSDKPTHKNLQYLKRLADDPEAMAMLDLFCIHGYAPDGATAAGADPKQWTWWTSGWAASPAAGIPANVKGFTAYNKRSWMTETSGEKDNWLEPASGFPKNGAFSLALKIQQALTAGQESAWLYWQFAEADRTTEQCLTGKKLRAAAPKYIAAKHFFKYIRPGALRCDARVHGPAALSASAFIHEADKTLTVVLVNSRAGPVDAAVELPKTPAGASSLQLFTSQNDKLWQESTTEAQGGKLTITVPGYGVVTAVGKGK